MIFLTLVSISFIFLVQIVSTRCDMTVDPTLKPANPFSAAGDAGILEKELRQSFITDREKVAKLWFKRTYNQRSQIEACYNDRCPRDVDGHYNVDECPLVDGFSCVSMDAHYKLYRDSLKSPEHILGLTVFNVIKGDDTEVGAIEEILCANDKDMKNHIAQFYTATYHDTVENHLSTFRGKDKDYQHVMQQFCWKGLCQEKRITPENADKEAKALRAFNLDTDKDGFKNKLIDLFEKNCEPDLKMIFEKYRNDKDGINDAIEKVFGVKRVRRAYDHLARYVENTCLFYADQLNDAVKGWGTSIGRINRIVLTRCERDMGCILKKYEESRKEKFTKRLLTDTLGEPRYRHSIRLLCGDSN